MFLHFAIDIKTKVDVILQPVHRKPFLLQQTAESECLNYNDIVRYLLLLTNTRNQDSFKHRFYIFVRQSCLFGGLYFLFKSMSIIH